MGAIQVAHYRRNVEDVLGDLGGKEIAVVVLGQGQKNVGVGHAALLQIVLHQRLGGQDGFDLGNVGQEAHPVRVGTQHRDLVAALQQGRQQHIG